MSSIGSLRVARSVEVVESPVSGLPRLFCSALEFFFGLVAVADARQGSHDRVYLDGMDISDGCYRAEAYFDGSLVVAHCFKRDSGGRFIPTPDRHDIERELHVGIGKIVPFRKWIAQQHELKKETTGLSNR